MAEIKYKTTWNGQEIKKVSVERSTKKSVWVSSTWLGKKTTPKRRNRITADYECYFDTWEEAKAHLVEKQQMKVDRLKNETAKENGILGQLKAMKKPEEK